MDVGHLSSRVRVRLTSSPTYGKKIGETKGRQMSDVMKAEGLGLM